MDVESLYTNIDTKMGLKAVQTLMNENPDPSRPDREIIQLLDISLSKSDFEFDNKYYLQIKKVQQWANDSPQPTQIYIWPHGRIQLFPNAPNYPCIIIASLMTSGVSGGVPDIHPNPKFPPIFNQGQTPL